MTNSDCSSIPKWVWFHSTGNMINTKSTKTPTYLKHSIAMKYTSNSKASQGLLQLL